MNNKDIIVLKNKEGIDEEVELILTANVDKKKYLLYKTKGNEVYASYLLEGDTTLYNDLTDNEYHMLEDLYKKGCDMYDNQ